METVAITGATGVVGRALAASLARDGIKVSALVRDTVRGAELLPAAILHAWDATKGPPPEAAFEGVGVVVNLMGEPVDARRWSEERKKVLRDSRVLGTRALVDGLRGLKNRPRVLISASGSNYYGDRGDQILTETTEAGTGVLAEMARDWEAEAIKAADLGIRVVRLRSGAVLSRKGGLLGRILPPFRLGLGGPVGTGRQWLPWIHLDDEVALIRHAMARENVSGALNAVAPEPVTNAEFVRALGEALGRPTVIRAPIAMFRLAVGNGIVDEMLLASQRVMPVRTLDSGFSFHHPLLRAALDEVLAKPSRSAPAPAATVT